MIYLGLIAVVLSLVIEVESFIKVKDLCGCKDSTERVKILLRGYPKVMMPILFMGSFLYFVFCICWIFNPNKVISIWASIMVLVSIASDIWGDGKPAWARRLDSLICGVGLLTIGYYLVRQAF